MSAITVTLGARSYTIRPLTLGQLRDVLPAFARAARLNAAEGIDAAIDILAAALRFTPKPKPARASFADLAALAPEGALAARKD
jgi:hypothetical protein